MRRAIVRNIDGFVVNIIEIEGKAKWQLPEGCYLIDAGDGSSGDTWDGKRFIKPKLPPYIPPRDLLAELTARVAKLEAK